MSETGRLASSKVFKTMQHCCQDLSSGVVYLPSHFLCTKCLSKPYKPKRSEQAHLMRKPEASPAMWSSKTVNKVELLARPCRGKHHASSARNRFTSALPTSNAWHLREHRANQRNITDVELTVVAQVIACKTSPTSTVIAPSCKAECTQSHRMSRSGSQWFCKGRLQSKPCGL